MIHLTIIGIILLAGCFLYAILPPYRVDWEQKGEKLSKDNLPKNNPLAELWDKSGDYYLPIIW